MRASVDWAMNTSRPPGRSSRAASGIHRYGSHQTDAPYSLITRSARPASHAETYPLPQPSSTTATSARPGGTGSRNWGMHDIPQYGSAAVHRERAYRSNQAGMCWSHGRRVTAT